MVDRERLVRMQVRRFANTCVAEEDLWQEGMLALLKADQTYDPNLGIKYETYASTVIRNRLIDVLRGYKAKDEEEPLVDDPVGKPLDNEIEHQRKVHLLHKALGSCTAIERAIFNAYWQGYSYKEIGGIFTVNSKKIDNTIQKIKKLVKSYDED